MAVNVENGQYSDIFNNINSPEDVKNLSVSEMNILAEDIRKAIINRVRIEGAHLGPNLGIVEATIALHYVFNSPKDKIIFDVSHQIYTHKMLTGRQRAFTNPLENPEINGYSCPQESEHDNFIIGHTSTSLSLACGTAKARDLKGEDYNVIALIGDGSLSGGEALEGLNNIMNLNSNMIILLNDNVMSIPTISGGIYNNLAELRETNGKSVNNIFKAMGYDYKYLDEGNDIEKLIEVFKDVKDTKKPVVVHIHTQKGKGYQPAEDNKETYHWILPGFMDNPEKFNFETYESITTDYLIEKCNNDKLVTVINASTPAATGLEQNKREKLGESYIDVGISEQHAIGYVSAMAIHGGKPVFEVMSSFIQRAYDQLSQDFALNNAPATVLVFSACISAMDSTHLGMFDIPLISNIPNIVYLAPTNKEEYLKMLDWSIENKEYSVAIRVPVGNIISTGVEDTTDYSILNKFKVENNGNTVAIIGVGNFYELGKDVKAQLKQQFDIDATLINPVYLTGLDEKVLNELKQNHKLVITLEDGCLDGGYGEKISRFYADSDMKVLNFGATKEFTDRISIQKLYDQYHLTPELIINDIKHILY